jgi:lysophospholipase L1-like esterase
MKRRDFIQHSAMSGIVGAGISGKMLQGRLANRMADLPSGLRILFQGDSITDAGRDRGNYYANEGKGMGGGYVYQIVADLLANHPQSQLQCFNRGISGHKVFQLANRWDLDCLAIRPDVLSILIGVNDYWHMLNGNYDGTREIYERDFTALLRSTRNALPDVKLIICEPFAVAGGSAINEKWGAFDAYREAAKNIAIEFDASFVPFHSMFVDALKLAPASYWCPDGVHPSIAGAALMKNAWLEAFNKLFM